MLFKEIDELSIQVVSNQYLLQNLSCVAFVSEIVYVKLVLIIK